MTLKSLLLARRIAPMAFRLLLSIAPVCLPMAAQTDMTFGLAKAPIISTPTATATATMARTIPARSPFVSEGDYSTTDGTLVNCMANMPQCNGEWQKNRSTGADEQTFPIVWSVTPEVVIPRPNGVSNR